MNNFTARAYVQHGIRFTAYNILDCELGTFSTRRAALRRVIKYFKDADEHELAEIRGICP